MNRETFNTLLEELRSDSIDTLAAKNAMYSKGTDDPLHNFNEGAEVDGSTPAQACWGYLTKHLVALRDMIKRNDFSNRKDFKEKCKDAINYIFFIWCIGNDDRSKYKLTKEQDNNPMVERPASEWTLKECQEYCRRTVCTPACPQQCLLRKTCDALEELAGEGDYAPGDWTLPD